MTEHLGYDKHDPLGRGSGNSRNGTRAKTVLTGIGPVEIEVPRDTNSSFEPQIVKKRQRRLTGIDEIVLSLTAKGLTTGEVAAHFVEVYGATVSKDTFSRITDKVIGEMTEWCNRPLEPVYPVVFIDAIHVKIRDGQVTNRPIYVAVGVTVAGERDILGLWAGEGGEGGEGQVLAVGADRDQKPRGWWCVHRGLRRAQGVAGGGQHGLGTRGASHMRGSSVAQHISLFLTQILGSNRQRNPAGQHRADRGGGQGTLRRIHRHMGAPSTPRSSGEDEDEVLGRLWENAWSEFVPFLDYDVEIRRVICSTNAVESINARIGALSAPAGISRPNKLP